MNYTVCENTLGHLFPFDHLKAAIGDQDPYSTFQQRTIDVCTTLNVPSLVSNMIAQHHAACDLGVSEGSSVAYLSSRHHFRIRTILPSTMTWIRTSTSNTVSATQCSNFCILLVMFYLHQKHVTATCN